MKGIKKLFASASPKFLLDHYWNVLDLIGWRGFINLQDKERGENSIASRAFLISSIARAKIVYTL